MSGTIHYEGPVPGPVVVWVFDDNGTKVSELPLPNGPGPYSVQLPIGKNYDVKAFRDANSDGWPNNGDPWVKYADRPDSVDGLPFDPVHRDFYAHLWGLAEAPNGTEE